MVVAISKAEAKRHNISIVYDSDQEYDEYWFFLCIHSIVHVVKLEPHSFYCFSISAYSEEDTSEPSGKEFGAIENASLRARIQAIRSKATSLIDSHTTDPQEIKIIINNIPWLFLQSNTPAELAAKKNDKYG